MVWSVDRITEGVAVLEGPGKEKRRVTASCLPEGTKEGDCLREEGGGYILDREETSRRRRQNIDLFRKLTKKNGNSQ